MVYRVLIYGVVAGAIAGAAISLLALSKGHHIDMWWGMAIGYLTMLAALGAVFAAIKRQRDVDGGGVIRFWPALGLGLGVSVVAGLVYAAAWETALALTHVDFASGYAEAGIAAERARGGSAADIARVTAQMAEFKASYADPLYRYAMTFTEIFPVGVLVSLISAGLLRNPRFMPANR